jgi:hypothetical protein
VTPRARTKRVAVGAPEPNGQVRGRNVHSSMAERVGGRIHALPLLEVDRRRGVLREHRARSRSIHVAEVGAGHEEHAARGPRALARGSLDPGLWIIGGRRQRPVVPVLDLGICVPLEHGRRILQFRRRQRDRVITQTILR